MNLGLPPLDSPVPLSPGVLPVHVRGLGHAGDTGPARHLAHIDLVVISSLAVLYLLQSACEDGGVSLSLYCCCIVVVVSL